MRRGDAERRAASRAARSGVALCRGYLHAGTVNPGGTGTGTRHACAARGARPYLQVMERMAGPGVIPGTPRCPLRFLRCQCRPSEQLSFRRRFPGFSATVDTGRAGPPTTTLRLLPARLPVSPLPFGTRAAGSQRSLGDGRLLLACVRHGTRFTASRDLS